MLKTLVEKFLSKIFSPSCCCCFCKSVSLCKYKTLELRSKRFEVRKPVWKPVCHFRFHWGWRPEVENQLPIGRGRSRDQNTGFLLVRPPVPSLDLREESINSLEQWVASIKSIGQWKASIKQYWEPSITWQKESLVHNLDWGGAAHCWHRTRVKPANLTWNEKKCYMHKNELILLLEQDEVF